MRHSNSVLVYILLSIIVSCNFDRNSKEFLIDRFPDNLSLNGERIELDSLTLCPEYIRIIDTLMIIMDMEFCSNSCFYVYHKDTYELLGIFGKKGKGPAEFINLDYPVNVVIDSSFLGIWVYDMSTHKNQLINITASLTLNRTIIEKAVIPPRSIVSGIGIFVLPNNDLTGTSMSQEGRLFYYDSEIFKTNFVDYFPEVTKPPYEQQEMHNLYTGPTGMNPDGNILVSALTLFKRLDVFNVNTHDKKLMLLYSIVFTDSPGDPPYMTIPGNDFPDELMFYYYDLFLTDKYIYALNINMSSGQIDRDEYIGSEIHVFTYDGKPVSKYILDHFVGKFTIDEENGYIYGLTYPTTDTSDDMFIRYQMY